MKRITAITRCNGVLTEVLNRKANRIRRAVEQMADAAEDKACDLREKAEDIINSLGDAAGTEGTPELQKRLNAYNDKIEEALVAERAARTFKELRKKLEEEIPNDEVEVPEKSTKK